MVRTFFSTASYYDAASTAPGGNLCGETGQALARFMLHAVGYACYAFYACLGIWGVVLLTRKELPSVVSKVVGLVFFTVFRTTKSNVGNDTMRKMLLHSILFQKFPNEQGISVRQNHLSRPRPLLMNVIQGFLDGFQIGHLTGGL